MIEMRWLDDDGIWRRHGRPPIVAFDTGLTWTDAYTDNANGTWTSTTPADNGDGTWAAP